MSTIEKVTAFITRTTVRGVDLLLFEHPYGGIQIPAGTVEPGEAPEAAARREAWEESGLEGLILRGCTGRVAEVLPDDERVTLGATTVYSRPDASSFDWVRIRRGISVRVLYQAGDWLQITYLEHDRTLNPTYVSFQITGWVRGEDLADRRVRHFYHLETLDPTPDRWTVRTDNHVFTLFWASPDALPRIIPPQDGWLAYLPRL